MNEYEEKLLSIIRQSLKEGAYHYDFDIPQNENDSKSLLTALKSLEEKSYLVIIASPESGYDFIEVELLPSCCRPPSAE